MSSAPSPDANVLRTFTTVFIPADASQAVAEWPIQYNNATEVSCLMDRLKEHFARRKLGDKDQASLREAVRGQIAEAMKKNGSAEQQAQPVSDQMVDMVLQMSSVDCVPLQNNKASTNYIGLMMYVDDQGKALNLPVNARATAVTFECGIPTQVLGDVVIARNFDDETNFRRIDFTLEEFERERQWKVDAAKANAERAAGGGQEKVKELQALLARAGKGTAQPQQTEKVCSFAACEQAGTLRCSRCKRSWYCSQACQKRDWKFHKANVCTPTPAGAEKASGKKAPEEKPADDVAMDSK